MRKAKQQRYLLEMESDPKKRDELEIQISTLEESSRQLSKKMLHRVSEIRSIYSNKDLSENVAEYHWCEPCSLPFDLNASYCERCSTSFTCKFTRRYTYLYPSQFAVQRRKWKTVKDDDPVYQNTLKIRDALKERRGRHTTS